MLKLYKIMKQIFVLLFMVSVTKISAQDLRLFENTWYLTKIVSNGIDYLPPTNTINLNFNQQYNSINSNAICNSMFGNAIFGNNLTNFSLNGGGITLAICRSQSDNSYENLYFDFFIGNYPNNNFTYTINENQTVKTLTINSSSNKQAIYTNQNLSTIDIKELHFKVFFDSTGTFLNVELNNQYTENIKVELFDSLGKTCKKESFSSAQIKISTADLASGIYVVKITTDNQVGIKKFIKP